MTLSKFIFIIFAILLFLSISSTYYNYLILHNYEIDYSVTNLTE